MRLSSLISVISVSTLSKAKIRALFISVGAAFPLSALPSVSPTPKVSSEYYCPGVGARLFFFSDKKLFIAGRDDFLQELFKNAFNDSEKTRRRVFSVEDCSTKSTQCVQFFATNEHGQSVGRSLTRLFLPINLTLGEDFTDNAMSVFSEPYRFGPYSNWKDSFRVELHDSAHQKKIIGGVERKRGLILIEGLDFLSNGSQLVPLGSCLLTSKRGIFADTKIIVPKVPYID
jgi:hypothetical protein